MLGDPPMKKVAGRTLPPRKKSQFGKNRKKNSQTQREWDAALSQNHPALDDPIPALDDPMELDVDPVVIILPAKKKARSDKNWRTTRAVEARDRKLEKERKKTKDAEKLAGVRLRKEKKKSATAVQKAAKEQKKTEAMKKELQSERKKRQSAEKKVRC